jgi:hypothetical protein
VVGQSFTLVLECYDDYDAANGGRSDFDSTTASMTIKRRNSTEPGTTLATAIAVATDGTNSELNTFTLPVLKDVISDYYDGKACVMTITIEGASGKNILFADVDVISDDGTGDNDIDSSDIEASTYQIDTVTSAPDANLDVADGYRIGDYVYDNVGTQLYRCDLASAAAAVWTAVSALDAYPGEINYLIDSGAGDLSIALPSQAIYTAQELRLSKVASGNTATLTGTINGTVNPALYDTQAVDVMGTGTAWYSPHYDKFIG